MDIEAQVKELSEIQKEIMKYDPILRLSFACTLLDEASSVLGMTAEEVEEIRAIVNKELGAYYGEVHS